MRSSWRLADQDSRVGVATFHVEDEAVLHAIFGIARGTASDNSVRSPFQKLWA